MIENIQDALDQFADYDLTEALSKDEPHDIISEIADSNCDVYTSDLLEWVKDNYHFVEDAISEFGHATDSEGKPDFIRQIMQGQYKANQELLWKAWEDIKENKEFKHFGNTQK